MQCRGPGFSQSKRSARNTRGGSGHFHASRVLCAKHRTQQINHLAVIWRVAPPLPKARPVRKKRPGLLGGGSTGWASIEPWLVLISCSNYLGIHLHMSAMSANTIYRSIYTWLAIWLYIYNMHHATTSQEEKANHFDRRRGRRPTGGRRQHERHLCARWFRSSGGSWRT